MIASIKFENTGINQKKWLMLGVATFSQICFSFFIQGIAIITIFWQDKFHLSHLQQGLLISAINIGPILSMIFLGNILDKRGERFLISICSILMGIIISLTLFIQKIWLLECVLFLCGIVYAISQPGGSKIIAKWFPSDKRGFAFGIRQAGVPTGYALASASLPAMGIHFGLKNAIGLEFIVAIIGGIIFYLLYKDHSLIEENNNKINIGTKILLVLKQKKFYPFIFSGMMLVALQFIIMAYLINYLHVKLHLSLITAGFLLTVIQLSGVFGRLLMGVISDKIFKDRIRPFLYCIWLTTIITMIFAFLTPETRLYFLFFLSILFGFFSLGWYSLFIAYLSENAEKNSVALTTSIALTFNQIAIVSSPLLFGFAIDFFGNYRIAWLIIASFIMISGVWLWVSHRRTTESPINVIESDYLI